jgi:hypothetical protein
MTVRTTKREGWIIAAGVIAGLAVPLLLGEAFTRLRPPANIQAFLGDASPMTGIYRSDPVLRVNYRSPDLYRPAEAPRLSEIPKNSAKPTWAFFGVSFIEPLVSIRNSSTGGSGVVV